MLQSTAAGRLAADSARYMGLCAHCTCRSTRTVCKCFKRNNGHL